jgi:chromosome segregation ATPase
LSPRRSALGSPADDDRPSLLAQISALQSQNAELRSSFNEVTRALDDSYRRHGSLTRKLQRRTARLQDLEGIAQSREQQQREAESAVSRAERENSRLRIELAGLQPLVEAQAALLQRVAELQAEIASAKSANRELARENKRVVRELTIAQADSARLSLAASERDNRADVVDEKLRVANAEKAAMEQRMAVLEDRAEALEDEVAVASRARAEAETRALRAIGDQMAKSVSENARFQKSSQELRDKLGEVRIENTKLRMENSALLARLEKAKRINSPGGLASGSPRSESGPLEDDGNDSSIEELERTNRRLTAELQELREEYRRLQSTGKAESGKAKAATVARPGEDEEEEE